MKRIFNTLLAVIKDITSFFWPLTKKPNALRAIVLVAVICSAIFLLRDGPVETAEPTLNTTPIVLTTTAASINASGESSFIGTVRAVAEAQIQSEVGGRLTGVNVTPGQSVSAGTIIATLENASERAAILQAEGSYESALAAAAQSDISVEDATNAVLAANDSAVNAYRGAYTTANNIVFSTLDTFFSDPSNAIIGVRVSVNNPTALATTRRSLQTSLPEWNRVSIALSTQDDIGDSLNDAIIRTNEIITLTDTLLNAVNTAETDETLDGQPVTSFGSTLNSARSSLIATLNSLESAKTTIASAEESLRVAQIGATGNIVSAADAQVKSALGSLRSAQANLAKTILRTPIAGTVNSVSVNTGDFISAFTPVAEVANNDALEISIFVGERDLSGLTVGDTVRIENTIAGTITSIAPALDPNTLKTEVRIGAESDALINGSTVTVQKEDQTTTPIAGPILAPLTAVKFTTTDGSMFFVVDNKLQARPVTIGDVRGSNIEIVSGLDRDEAFVVDARGLVSGTAVEARNQK